MDAARFEGFGPGLYGFFEGLAANNDKAWFTAHRAEYLSEVKAPLEALLAELSDEFGDGRLFRINRDIRFSPDKRPYKTAQGAIVDRGPAGTLYLQVDADGVMIGAGAPHFDTGQLARWRAAVASEEGVGLQGIIAGLRRSSIVVGTITDEGVGLGGDLKRVPSPYPQDHPRAELLKLKKVVAARYWPRPAWLERREALSRVRATWQRMAPLSDWLADHVGAAAPGTRR